MNYFLKTLTVLTVLFFLQSLKAQVETLDKETTRKIDSLFNAYYQQNETGAILSIIKYGKTVYTNKEGIANVEYQIPITETTKFNIASNSKQFTIFLALLLEEEGKLSLDDDIRKHLPELKDLPNKITIIQLANHTHGLPNADQLAFLKGIINIKHSDVLEMLLNIRNTNFNAGDKLAYNNTGFILLAEIIERVGEKPFELQLEERIFKPLGMNNSQAIAYTDDVVKNKAYSYKQWEETYIELPINLATIGSSGIYTTINDLSLWAKNYQNPVVGKRSFYEKMEKLTFLNDGTKTNYGLGLQKDIYKGIDIVFHGGGTQSYRSYILHAPEHDLSFVFLSNKGDMAGLDILYNALEYILEDAIKIDKPFTILKGKALKSLQGNYEIFPGKMYTITVENDKLFFKDFGSQKKYHLPQTGANTFKYPVPHHTFVFNKHGFNFHIADMTYPCTKVDLALPLTDNLELDKYTGYYKNTAHNMTYEVFINNGKLLATLINKGNNIELQPLAENSFYSNVAYFGRLDFKANEYGFFKSFTLSGQKVNNIIFTKI